jgi:hypothetical protein
MAGDYISSLETARANAAARLAEVLSSPKPSYSVHGHTFSWNEYQKMLMDQIAACNTAIAQGTPVEFITVAH